MKMAESEYETVMHNFMLLCFLDRAKSQGTELNDKGMSIATALCTSTPGLMPMGRASNWKNLCEHCTVMVVATFCAHMYLCFLGRFESLGRAHSWKFPVNPISL